MGINNLPSILITGGNGLIGSNLIEDFSHKYNFQNLDRRDLHNPVDILDLNSLTEQLDNSEAKFLIHMAAFTDVNAAYAQQSDKSGSAYQINVIGTQNIIKACQETNKHLIHISTAYIFDGKKEGLYLEEDKANPIEWYGQTKYEAELAVMNSNIDWTILRIDTPFRSDNFEKADQVRKIIKTIKDDIPLFADHYFGPTYVDDFAKIIDWVIRTSSTGLYHASSGEKWSDYDFGVLINKVKNLGLEVKAGQLEDYLKTLNRPYQKNTAMDCSKLKSEIDFKLKSVEETIREVKL